MKTITGCILAKNEEKLIRGCIRSLRPFVNEIIVVDNNSNDRTAEIARDEGCMVLFSNESNVDKSRNYYLKKASGDWLLILDADERLDITKRQLLWDIIDTLDDNIFQLRIPIYNYIGNGKFVETSSAGRIVKNIEGLRYNNFEIHASLTDFIKKVGGESKKVFFPIHHFDIINGERTVVKREKYQTKLLSTIDEFEKNPKHFTELENIYVQYVFLGAEYSAQGNTAKAIECYDKAIEVNDSTAGLAMLYKAFTLFHNNDYEGAEKIAEFMIKNNIFPERAYSVIIEKMINNGERKRAIEFSRSILSRNSETVHVLLNHAYLISDDDPHEAIKLIWKAAVQNPLILENYIYNEPNYPNINSFQSSFLKEFDNIFALLAILYERIGDRESALYWEYRYKYMERNGDSNEGWISL